MFAKSFSFFPIIISFLFLINGVVNIGEFTCWASTNGISSPAQFPSVNSKEEITQRKNVVDSGLVADTLGEFSPQIAIPKISVGIDSIVVQEKSWSPKLCMIYSAAFPGMGQLYSRNFARGICFTGAVGITALVSVGQYKRIGDLQRVLVDYYHDKMIEYADSMHLSKTLFDKYTEYAMEYDMALYKKQGGIYGFRHSVGWLSALYIWNIADALSGSHALLDTRYRRPSTAGWLSAVPFLGLGQIYNGSYSKAGLILTFETMLAYLAFDYNRDLNRCIRKRNEIIVADSISKTLQTIYLSRWQGEYNHAYKLRNTSLWYFFAFYFYGIFDAVVDAHLHDYIHRIRISPSVQNSGDALRLNCSITAQL